jgi:hypothetical protein
MENRFEEVE